MKYRTPITIEKLNIQTEEWEAYLDLLHANINKNAKDNEFLSSGAVQSKRELAFDVRYCPPLKEIARNTQLYRIVYDGVPYNIADYDDYNERHQNVRLLGVSY